MSLRWPVAREELANPQLQVWWALVRFCTDRGLGTVLVCVGAGYAWQLHRGAAHDGASSLCSGDSCASSGGWRASCTTGCCWPNARQHMLMPHPWRPLRAVNLAASMATALGLRVGLMDADVHGPSIPTMMNLHGEPTVSDEGARTRRQEGWATLGGRRKGVPAACSSMVAVPQLLGAKVSVDPHLLPSRL
jgi:hypothetical protein